MINRFVLNEVSYFGPGAREGFHKRLNVWACIRRLLLQTRT